MVECFFKEAQKEDKLLFDKDELSRKLVQSEAEILKQREQLEMVSKREEESREQLKSIHDKLLHKQAAPVAERGAGGASSSLDLPLSQIAGIQD